MHPVFVTAIAAAQRKDKLALAAAARQARSARSARPARPARPAQASVAQTPPCRRIPEMPGPCWPSRS